MKTAPTRAAGSLLMFSLVGAGAYCARGVGPDAGAGAGPPGGGGVAGTAAAAGIDGNAGSAGTEMPGAGGGGATAGTDMAGNGGGAGAGGNAGFASGGTAGGWIGGGAGGAAFEPVLAGEFAEVRLFPGNPPNFRVGAPPEREADGGITDVSIPTLRRYPFNAAKATGIAYVIAPGGSYLGLAWDLHVVALAMREGPKGIAILGLKYRVGQGSTDARRDAILDAERAMRLVRANASRWGVAVDRIGFIGYSAGSDLARNLGANFDSGSPASTDPIERQSSRPTFLGHMSTWGRTFNFSAEVPPSFFCHAQDDTASPLSLVYGVEEAIRNLGVATMFDIYPTGGHSTCHVGDASVPGRNWPDKLLPWLRAKKIVP